MRFLSLKNPPVGSSGQSPGHRLRLPSTSLRSAQGGPSKTSLPSGPYPEGGPTARGHGPSRGVAARQYKEGLRCEERGASVENRMAKVREGN